jgi:CBS domain-containing protein
MKIDEIMTREVLTTGPEAEVRDVARILVENHISGMPVCNAQREVIGVVSEADILFKEHDPNLARRGAPFSWFSDRKSTEGARKACAFKVEEAMTAPAITISAFCSVAEAARLMTEQGVNRLPVVGAHKLVGIITRADLVRAFVRSDEDIRDEIYENVLRRNLWIEAPEAVVVIVKRGTVHLAGTLETRSDAQLLERLTARVTGVVAVESKLSWTTDDTTRKARRQLRSTQQPLARN